MKRIRGRYITSALLILSSVMSAASCASTTRLAAVWTDKNYSAGPFRRIAVVGILNGLESRQMVENSVALALEENGAGAIIGLSILPPDRICRHEEMESAFKDVKADGILFISLKRVDKKQYIGAEQPYTVLDPYHHRYYDYYLNYNRMLTTTGYIREYDIYVIESALYSSSDDKLVWMAETRTTTTNNAGAAGLGQEHARDLTAVIIKSLKRQKLIK